ncbi:DUF2599 domain-containing protein [Streptomyces sp. NPDC007369]|uniref:DUF2599 domain-containing protein n=1 Tax=Streptomyces sp. NPDC007369 TaxID=3154589 RepID=UPI00340F9D6D
MRKSSRALTASVVVKATLLTAGTIAGLVIQAAPASADELICGQWVRGAILDKFKSMGGTDSPLGCPTTEERRTPDGRGYYSHFQGGSIYWSAQTGAHPVWGAIRDKWASSGWEAGKLGFPVEDELPNPDGEGRRQRFEGGTFYWHPTKTNGAHAMLGRIGQLWGEYGWEGGAFGYPVTDEMAVPNVAAAGNGIGQLFERGQRIVWSPGNPNAYETCTSECVGYTGYPNTSWVDRTEVYKNLATGKRSVHVSPTAAGYKDADSNFDELWRQVWNRTPYPVDMSQTQVNTVAKQLWCHALYAYDIPIKGHLGGDTWDLEMWKPDVPWNDVIDPQKVLQNRCLNNVQ